MTSLLLSARRLPDGRIVLTNAKGEELPMQVAPTNFTATMQDAQVDFDRKTTYLSHPDVPYHGTDNYDSAEKWANRLFKARYKALLSAASVDVSEAVVERAD